MHCYLYSDQQLLKHKTVYTLDILVLSSWNLPRPQEKKSKSSSETEIAVVNWQAKPIMLAMLVEHGDSTSPDWLHWLESLKMMRG